MATIHSITFLGTGTSSGVPMIGCTCSVCTSSNPADNRLRSSILVQSANTTLLIDATPDFRQQMLRIGLKKLDAILITHAHKDHVGGLDDTRALQYLQQKPTDIYGTAQSLAGVKIELPYAFDNSPYPGVPVFNLFEISSEPFTIGDIVIQPISVWHHKLKVTAFRIGKFVYITDANRIDEHERQKILGAEIVVVNALRKEPHISHYTLQEALFFLQSIDSLKLGFLTHISHQLGLHSVVNAQLPMHIQLAYDGLQITSE